MSTRPPYQGPHRKLVLAFDVGTTFSGISYSILDPGQVPEIRGVTRYPAQEQVGEDSKIPTIIYYDRQGNVRAVGAEAMREGIEDQAEESDWTKVEWFKLHLRPRTQSAAHITDKIPPLPDGKADIPEAKAPIEIFADFLRYLHQYARTYIEETNATGVEFWKNLEMPPLPQGKAAIEVFADFLRYLHQCARMYIEETHAMGVELWKNLESRTDFVLTHPNGWEGAQQSLMRKAAVMAGLIPDTQSGNERLSFVTEGEASLHFCIQSGLTNEAIEGVLIVDAGGGTIDISTYKQTSQDTKSFEEIAAPQCHFRGSIFVTNNAKTYLENSLKNSRFLCDVPHITKCFDKTTKLRFRNADESQYIKFGNPRDTDQKLNIRFGQLKLKGSDVASFFEPSIQCIIKSIEEQCAASQTEIASVFLVGGFAASDWLFTKLKETFSPRGLDVSRPDSHVNKAVAHGAVSFYVDHFVASRVSKLAYGLPCSTHFQPQISAHQLRAGSTFQDPSGVTMISGFFDVILPKNTKVAETEEFRHRFRRLAYDPAQFRSVVVNITCYRGTICLKEEPSSWFMDKDPNMFSTLCRVEADTSRLSFSPKASKNGWFNFYELEFDVILSLGLTELKAQICWTENGLEKRSPAQVVYDPDVVIKD